ncbi:MAG: hypothetical protein WBP12_03785 [Candidatus Saccharimonas sp.]
MTDIRLLEIGDHVTLEVPSDHREWTSTFNDVPNGTPGVVCGFHEAVTYWSRVPVYGREPGVYYVRGAAKIWLPNGRTVESGGFAQLVNREEEARRDAALRDESGILRSSDVRISDLPDTKFWEQDEVFVPGEGKGRIATVYYDSLGKLTSPMYRVEFYPDEYNSMISQDSAELVARGNVWRHYHNEPLEFEDINAEAEFFTNIGQTTEVKNPRSNLYDWTLPEALQALRVGLGHGVTVSPGLFGAGPHVSVRRFHDEELGARVATVTLERLS